MRKDRLKSVLLSLFFTISCFLNPLQAQFLEIWEIQGDGESSPYEEQVVTTLENIVIAVGDDRFFMQTPPSRSDNDPNTSDAIMVFTSSNPNVVVGDLVSVSGRVNEVDDNTQFNSLGLQFDIVDIDQDLPPVVNFDEDFPSNMPASPHPLEAVEGMVVDFNATCVAPSSNGDIAGLATAEDRPFREPGIKFPGQSNLPVWDGNPEIFWLDPDGLTQPNNRFIGAGMIVAGQGPIMQDDDRYIVLPASYNIGGQGYLTEVREKELGEITVGCLNVLLLNPNTSSFQTKLRKLSKYIVESMNAPDILGLQELANSNALNSLRNFILQNYGINYTPYFEQGTGNVNTGYLVKSFLFTNVTVIQLGANENISLGGPLHDRPPLLLSANVVSDPPTPIRVLNMHMRSLLDIEGENSFFVRTKRHEQAISVAEMVQDRQDENLILIGDFNAFQFTDGYVDVMNQISGTESLGAIFTQEDIVDPPLTNHMLDLPEEEQYSFVFNGSAQILDHCLSVQDLDGMDVVEVQYARGNADQPVDFSFNDQLVNRASDHDGFVAYISIESPITSISTIDLEESLKVDFQNPLGADQDILVEWKGKETLSFEILDAQGKQIQRGAVTQGQQSIVLTQLYSNGSYFLRIGAGKDFKTWKMIVKN
jgi:endonuclease/exonuclease/phosphatase family metal-dependent hydrolase